MNNKKSLILNERVRFTWIIAWAILLMANILVYINNPMLLSVDAGSDFNAWILKFLSPHNWLGLATFGLTLYGLRSIWLICEQKWPLIKGFRFVPLFIIIAVVLIFISATF